MSFPLTDISSSVRELNARNMPHGFPFDPTYGYNLGKFLAITPPPEPDDFDAWWQSVYEEALQHKPSLRTEEIDSPNPDRRLYRIQLESTDSLTLQGWLDIPRTEPIESLTVQLHGYGGRTLPEPNPLPRCAVLQPVLRGLPLNHHPGIPQQSKDHVLHGIADRNTYVLRGCVIDTICAATALLDRYPHAADRLYLHGGSFGGGIGALTLAIDTRFTKAFLAVPTFSHHPLRLTFPCQGSGEAVRLYSHRHPEVSRVLAYYDSVTAATRIRIPTMISAALFDPSVPPPGQFAVFNAIQSPKLLYVRLAGHFEYPQMALDEDDLGQIRRQFFEAPGNDIPTGLRLSPSLQISN